MMKVRAAVIAAAALLVPALAFGQGYPNRSIRIIVPYPAGGGVDFVARTVGQRLSEVVGQAVVVENRSGASGSIGAAAVAGSAPDGYTLLLASPAEVVVGPLAGQKVPYDHERAFAPVTLVGETPLAIVAHPSAGVKDVAELIAAARKEPSRYSYATPGNGSSMHFAGESLNALGGITLMHVPYKGAAPAVTDLLGGQVPIGIVGMPPVVQPTKAGKLRMLAVTSTRRSPTLPDVPTVAELKGMDGYRFTNWMGLFAPAGTPAEAVDRLAKEIAAIVREPAVRDKLLSQGVVGEGNTPEEFVAFLKGEAERYGRIAKERNIRVAY